MRLAAVAFVAMFVGACTAYDLALTAKAPDATSTANTLVPNDKLPEIFRGVSPYLDIYASANEVNGSPVNLCQESWTSKTLTDRTRAISVAVDLSNGNNSSIIAPLFAVNSSPDNGCDYSYNNRYIYPRAVIGKTKFTLPIQLIYQDKASENITGWLGAAVALAAAFAPAGSPAVGVVDSVMKSPLAQQLSATVNQQLSSSTRAQRGLITIDGNDQSFKNEVKEYVISAVPYTTHYTRKNKPAIEVAKLTLDEVWRRTALEANESNNGLHFASSLSEYSPIYVINPSTGIAQSMPIATILQNRDPGIIQFVGGLDPSVRPTDATSLCNKLKSNLTDFNDLDKAAILWLIYRNSPLARNNHVHNNTERTSYTCLTRSQIDGLITLGIPASESRSTNTDNGGQDDRAPAPAPPRG